jgi:hypothetical protein
MEPVAAAPQQPARQADHLGWFGGLVVGLSGLFGLLLAYILVFQGSQPSQRFPWAQDLVGVAWGLQGPSAFGGLVSTLRAAWHRRFGRAAVWLVFTAWALLVLVGGSVPLFALVIGAPSVGDPPGVNYR